MSFQPCHGICAGDGARRPRPRSLARASSVGWAAICLHQQFDGAKTPRFGARPSGMRATRNDHRRPPGGIRVMARRWSLPTAGIDLWHAVGRVSALAVQHDCAFAPPCWQLTWMPIVRSRSLKSEKLTARKRAKIKTPLGSHALSCRRRLVSPPHAARTGHPLSPMCRASCIDFQATQEGLRSARTPASSQGSQERTTSAWSTTHAAVAKLRAFI